MTMFHLIVLIISQKIFPNEGQPMGPNCMDVYPLEGENTQSYQKLAICPLVVSPSMRMPCDVEQIDIPEPHKFEQWKRGKWKMVRIKRIPWKPCVMRLKPHEVGGSRHTNQETGKGNGEFENETPVANHVEKYKHTNENIGTNFQNCTLHDSSVDSSPIETRDELALASQIPQVPDFGNKTQNSNLGETPQPIKDEVTTIGILKSTLSHLPVDSSLEDKKNETPLNKPQVADIGNNTQDPNTGKTHQLNNHIKTITVVGRKVNYTPYSKSTHKDTGNVTTLKKPQMSDENGLHNVSTLIYNENGWISSLCQSSMILYERYGLHPNKTTCAGKPSDGNRNLTNLENTKNTTSPAIKIKCESPGLVTLSCLACMIAKNAQNNTVNGTILMKNLDGRLDPSDYVTVGAGNTKNSSSSQIHRMLTKDQMAALEDCLADRNKSEPYLVNGRPLIVNLKYLNQTEKQFVLTKKTGHDFLIALPRENDQGKDEHRDDNNDKSIYDLSTSDNNLTGNLLTESSRTNGLEDMLTNMKEEETQETKVARHMSNDLPHATDEPKKLENSTTPDHQDEIWSDSEEEQGHYYDYRSNYQSLIQPLQCDHNPLDNIETQPTHLCQPLTLLPRTNQYYAKPNIALTTPDHFSKMPSLNHEYARQMEPLAYHLFELPNYVPQPAPFVSQRQIQGTINDMKDHTKDRCASFQTLRHGARLDYPINCKVSPYALNVGTKPNSSDPSHKPGGQYERKAEVKYEKCRRIECLMPGEGIQFTPEARSSHWENLKEQPDDGPASRWECEEYAAPRSSPELNRYQCSDLGSTSWHEDQVPQQSQINPENYIMTRNLQHWSQRQPIIQQPLILCPRRIY